MERLVARVLAVVIALGGLNVAGAMTESPPLLTDHKPSFPERFGLFQTPLVPVGTADPAEKRDLMAAMAAYKTARRPEDTAALDRFLQRHPHSAWRPALLTNEGLAYENAGEFSKAIEHFQGAWDAARKASGLNQEALAEVAYGELLRLHTAFGHAADVKTLLSQSEDRPLMGSAQVQKTLAQEGLWVMEHEPSTAYICGLIALRGLLDIEHDTQGIKALDNEKLGVGEHGLTLAQLQAMSAQAGFDTRMVYRTQHAPIPVPSIVHWQLGHYATITEASRGRYHIQDAALGRDFWMRRDAVESESSGYFLVPASANKGEWRTVAQGEASQVIGAGYTSGNNPEGTSNDDANVAGCGGCGSSGMVQYSVKAMLVSLSLHDTPVGYTPPRGPAVPFTLVYSQYEYDQPATFTYFNFGQKWISNWLSYVQDYPSNPGYSVRVHLRGGGSREYMGYNSSTGAFAPEERTGAQLVLVSRSPVVYERRLPDGSKEVYGQSDTPGWTRHVFLTRVVDPTGNAVSLTYDNHMRLTALTDALGQQTTLQYDNTQFPLQVTGITDPFGRRATIDYDSSGRLIAITDVIGMQSQFTYDGGTFITAMTTPYGTTHFAGGQNGSTERWLEITDPMGRKERVEYRHSAPGIPFSDSPVPAYISTFNAYINARDTYFWDKTAMQLAPGDYTKAQIYHWLHEENSTYYLNGLTSGVLESIKAPLEHRIWYNYQGQTWAGGTGGITIDKPSAIAKVLDDGTTQLTRFRYNAIGHVTQSIDPKGRELDYTYASNGIDLIEVTRRTGNGADVLAQYTYNAQHRPLTYTDAAGQTTNYSYNSAGQLTSVTDPLGNTTSYGYDSNGYLLSITDPNGKSLRSYTYDGYGRMASITDSEGYTLQLAYDDLNRPTAVTYPDGTQRKVAWDKLDIAATTDREGHTTSYDYDSVRDLLSKTDPLGQITAYSYYANGKLKSLIDPNGNSTTWSRDIQGRIIARAYADGSKETYSYDLIGRLGSKTDPQGQVTGFTYAIDDAPIAIGYTNVVHPTPSVSLAYDPYYPRLVSRGDVQGTTTYSYYPAGVLGAGMLKAEQGADPHDSLQYSYDAVGRRAGRTVDGAQENYTYDNLGRLTGETNPLGTFGNYYLGETHQPTAQTIAKVPFQVTYQYESNLNDRRLRSILNDAVVNQTLQPLVDYTFTTSPEPLFLSRTLTNGENPRHHGWDQGLHKGWDQAPYLGVVDWLMGAIGSEHGNPTNKGQASARAADDHGKSQTGAVTTQYTYDDALRLTAVQGGSTESYTYDDAGNIAQLTSGSSSTPFTFNDLNQITTAGSTSYVYDANGNLVDDGIRTYAWDAADRLVEITNKQTGHTTQFGYDAFSRRITDVETDLGGSPITTKFLWCGGNLCEQRDSSDNVLARYYRQGELHGGAPYYYAKDQVGSVVALVDSTGQVAGRLSYDSYGNITSASGTLPDFRYAGLFYHAGSSLNLATYRDYDAKTGRWISRDPIREAGGINLYSYLEGDPINYVDPLGLYCLSEETINAMSGAAGGATSGAAALAEFGPIGWAVGGAVGGIVGGIFGYLSPTTAAGETGAGAAVGYGSALNTPVSGLAGGAIGGAVTYGAQQAGAPDSAAVPLGGAVGGAAGGALSASLELAGTSATASELAAAGGAIGLAGAGVTVGVQAALKAGNDCSCGK